MEGLVAARTVSGRVRQRADRVEQLDHRPGPAVGHDQRQRVLVRRRDVDEVDVHAVDLRDELRQLVQTRLDAPEVVLVQPIAGEGFGRGKLHALRPFVDQLLARPACRGDTPSQIINLLLRKPGPEGSDRRRGLGSSAHRMISHSRMTPPPEPTHRLPAGQERDTGSSHFLMDTPLIATQTVGCASRALHELRRPTEGPPESWLHNAPVVACAHRIAKRITPSNMRSSWDTAGSHRERAVGVVQPDAKCAYGCAYRLVSRGYVSLQFAATANRANCSSVHSNGGRFGSFDRTFNPKGHWLDPRSSSSKFCDPARSPRRHADHAE